ncbi:DNA polymerase IV [Roseateles terrae]|uniref:DNA polymerase IV n=1 Tax=Roseateles terrae TaxID=431060 RepID=A0ABR6GQD0_9BURK|nr:DNA polymerase IV [Roseateles terrae]MBB3194331.1 DNA polymerase-4 [Roseateles terrae]OWQ88168.1 DNA polymerase IV [Roseateles terrae]
MADSTPSLPDRLIAHLDMDAFYASVELLRYPELKGMPVVVGGRRAHTPQLRADGTREFYKLQDYTGRGVVTTSTYPARALGVFSAMGLMKAALLAPQAILLPADFEAYRHYSRLFKAAVREMAPVVEDRGIDEIYIDLTDVPGVRDPVGHDPLGGVRSLARDIKNSVFSATGLTCSIGVTPNKLLSKIASELDKPDGLTVLTMDDLPTRIWPLPVRRINGIGPKAGARLNELGIETVGQLAQAPQELLSQHFGPGYSVWLHQAAWGLDDRPVVTYSEPVSISRETTFERDLHAKRDRAELSSIFTALCEQLSSDLQRKGYQGRTIGIKLRFEGFRTVTRDLTLDAPVQDAASIRQAAGQCLKRVDLTQRLRLLGVRVGKLSRPGTEEPGRKTRRAGASAGGAAGAAAQSGPVPETLPLFD